MSQWFKEFETSCAQSEKILRKKKKKTYDLQDELYGISLGDGREIDRIRFCDVNEKDNEVGPVAVKIPDSLLQSRMDVSFFLRYHSNHSLTSRICWGNSLCSAFMQSLIQAIEQWKNHWRN